MASTSSTSLKVSSRCTNCNPDLPAAFLSFTSRQQSHLAFHLNLTHDDAFANGAFAPLKSSAMSLRTLLDDLIASPLIPEADKTTTFRPWRSLLIDLTNADPKHMDPAAYYRMQAQMDLLCYSSVQPRNDNDLHGPDLTRARDSIAEAETQMQMPAQEGFALEDMAGDAGLIDPASYSTMGMDDTSACAGEGAAEASEDRELLADIERLAGTPERAKIEMESSRALFEELFRRNSEVLILGSTAIVMFVLMGILVLSLIHARDKNHG